MEPIMNKCLKIFVMLNIFFLTTYHAVAADYTFRNISMKNYCILEESHYVTVHLDGDLQKQYIEERQQFMRADGLDNIFARDDVGFQTAYWIANNSPLPYKHVLDRYPTLKKVMETVVMEIEQINRMIQQANELAALAESAKTPIDDNK